MHNKKKEFTIKTRNGVFKVHIWWDGGDRVYLVKGVSLPDVITFGRTLAEAKRMAREALELYCECAVGEGKIVVDDTGYISGKLPKTHVIELVR